MVVDDRNNQQSLQSAPLLSQHQHTPLPNNDDSSVVELVSAHQLINLRTASSSRRNFATQVMRQIFSLEERKISNVNGKNKRQLDPTKIAFLLKSDFSTIPN